MTAADKKRKEILNKWGTKMAGMTADERNAFIKEHFSKIYNDFWDFTLTYGEFISIKSFIDIKDLRLGDKK